MGCLPHDWFQSVCSSLIVIATVVSFQFFLKKVFCKATFYFQMIGKSPTVLDDMIHCLGVNQLTSPSTSAFKAFLEWERYTLILVKFWNILSVFLQLLW